MTSTGKHPVRRGGWIILGILLAIVIASLNGLATLQRYTGRQATVSRQQRQTVDAKVQATLAAHEKRRADREAAVEQARANLPPDAGIPRDWSYEELLKSIDTPTQGHPTVAEIQDTVTMGCALLESTDVPDAPPDRSAERLSTVQETIKEAKETGQISTWHDQLDLSKYTRGEVLHHVERFLDDFAPLREMETGYKLGILSIRKCDPYKDADSPCELSYILTDALVARAGFEVVRGDLDRALRSWSTACEISDLYDESQDYLPTGPIYWYSSFLVDLLWRVGVPTQEQRNQILSHLAVPASQELMEETLYDEVQGTHEYLDSLSAELNEGFMRILLAFSNRSTYRDPYIRKLNSVTVQLPPLLNQSPYQALPSMEKLAAKLPGVLAGYSILSDLLLRRMAKAHAESATSATLPDVARVVFALKDYKHAHGEYPKTLDGLCPDPIPPLPMDPLSGQPMLYTSDGKTFAISLHKMTPGPGSSEFLKKHAQWVNDNTMMWFATE